MDSASLLEHLAALPDDLSLVAVGGNKAPYLPHWQKTPLSKAQLRVEISAGRCKAVGVLCGCPSGGLLFLDHDGESCDLLIETLSETTLAEALPKTVGVTSGRPGRYQLLYRVPKQDQGQLTTRKLKTDTPEELLEFRWDGCQSVVIGHHPMTGAYQYLPGQSFSECQIAEAPQWVIQQMQAETQPLSLNWTEFERHFQLPINAVVPLTNCLSKASRNLLSGVHEGNRDNTGAKLARDLLGTADYLKHIYQSYSGDPQQILMEFCQRCAPPLSEKDCDRIWKSALKDNPGPSLSPEQIEGCIKGWQWRQLRHQPSESIQRNRAADPQANETAPTLEDLQTQIRQFLLDAPTETQLTAQIMLWATAINKPERTLWALVNSIQRDLEHQQTRQEVKGEISHLTRLSNYQPHLSHYLHPTLARPLDQLAHWMGTTSMAMLTTLLPVVGSLLPVGTELELNCGTEHNVYPILYTGIVAESGTGKSPAQKTILKPLFRLQAEAEQVYQADLEDWEQERRTTKDSDRPPPAKPQPRDYFTTDATREAVVQIQANQPNAGFVGWFDELSGLIRGQNQYRNGRGADKESLLSGRDGSAQKVDRAGGKRLFIARSAYSITGSTQPDTLRSLMGDFSDPSGQWARFLWCFLPIQAAPYPEQAIHLDISGLLYGTYNRLTDCLPTTYRLSPEARRLYINWYNELDQLRLAEVRQSLRAVFAKIKSDTGILALLLHCVNAAIAVQTPSEQISAETMQAAINLSKFYLGQVKLIHSEGDALEGDLAPNYCKILALSERKGWVTARDIYRGRAVCDRKMPLDQIRVLMQELVTMGLAVPRNEGNRLEIKVLRSDSAVSKAGDNAPQTGDNILKFGDSNHWHGDSNPVFEDYRETVTTIGQMQERSAYSNGHSSPTVTTEALTVTKNCPVVTTKQPIVTQLSPSQKMLEPQSEGGFEHNGVSVVTTKPNQSQQARPPTSHYSAIQVGDVCRYRGPDGVMNVTCWGKDLHVMAIENGMATVKAQQWVHTHQIEEQHLQKRTRSP
ncbi:MAG: DUF3987 domain-containing protein [Thermosynechococcaceae cyanobacterium]